MTCKGGFKNLFRRKVDPGLAREREERAGLTALRPADDTVKLVRGDGQISLSFTGTFSARIAPLMLSSIEAGAIDSFIGPICVNELSKPDRDICVRAIPAAFQDRLTVVHAALSPGGQGGSSIARALEKSEYWLPDVQKAASQYCDAIHRHWAATDVGPMLHLAGLSGSGSAATGRPVLEALKARFPSLPIFAYVPLDHKDVIRRRWPDVWEYYNSIRDLLRGMIILDNARDQHRNDAGIAQLLTGLTAGTWLSEKPLGPLNILSLVFPEDEPGHVAMISVEALPIPVFERTAYADKLGTLTYTNAEVVRDALLRGIKEAITNQSLQSLGMKKAGKGDVRGLCCLLPVVPDHALPLAQDVEARLQPWLFEHDRNIVLQFASVGEYINPQRMTGVITFILLQRIRGDGDDVSDYVRRTLAGPPSRFLPGPPNGHKAGQLRKALAVAPKKGGK